MEAKNMKLLKKIWPFSFESNSLSHLVLKVIVYVVIGLIFAILMGLLHSIPVINVLFFIIGPLVDLYVLVGLVLLLLDYFKVLK